MVNIKGLVVNDSIKAVKARFGDQIYNSIVERLQGETRELFERTRIMSADWYSLNAFVEFLEMDILLTAQGNEAELIRRSEALVEQHLKGVYKLFIRFGSPEFVLNRLAVVHRAYFQGVEIAVSVPAPGKAIVRYTGFAKEHRLIGMSIIGYFRKAFEISGAREVKAGFTTSIDEGKGFCELALSWVGKS